MLVLTSETHLLLSPLEDLCLTLLPLEIPGMSLLGWRGHSGSILRSFVGFLLSAVHSLVTCNSAVLYVHLNKERDKCLHPSPGRL